MDLSVPFDIALSKTKSLLAFLGVIAFVGIGVWMWGHADSQTFPSSIILKCVALLCGFFFAACGIVIAVKLFDFRPGLRIDREGIVDNSSGFPAGRIPWSEIAGFAEAEVSGQRMVAILLVDPQAFIERFHPARRWLLAANLSLCGSPICIASVGLKIDHAELVRALLAAHESYRDGAEYDAPVVKPWKTGRISRTDILGARIVEIHGVSDDQGGVDCIDIYFTVNRGFSFMLPMAGEDWQTTAIPPEAKRFADAWKPNGARFDVVRQIKMRTIRSAFIIRENNDRWLVMPGSCLLEFDDGSQLYCVACAPHGTGGAGFYFQTDSELLFAKDCLIDFFAPPDGTDEIVGRS